MARNRPRRKHRRPSLGVRPAAGAMTASYREAVAPDDTVSLLTCVDYLAFTIWGQPATRVEKSLAPYFSDDFRPGGMGRLGYKEQRVGPYGAFILSTVNRPDVHVNLPGQACGSLDEPKARALLQFIAENGHVTRVDLAGDDWERRATPRDVWAALQRGERVSRIATKNWRHVANLDGGVTVYGGSTASRQRLRLYDKAPDLNCIRWEIQARDAPAQTLAAQLVTQPWGSVWASRLVGLVDFRDRGANAKVGRCPRSPWYAALVSDADRARAYPPRPAATLEMAEAWLRRSASPILAAVFDAKGGDIGFLVELAQHGRTRWTAKHLAIAGAPDGPEDLTKRR